MRRAEWTGAGIAVVEGDAPAPRAGWAPLAVRACGICGTDLHLWRGELPARRGGVPGHEFVGVPLAPDRDLEERLYAVEPRVWCGACDACAAGRRQLCRRGKLLGIDLPGGLAEQALAPRVALHPVDPSVAERVASAAEPLAVCVRAVHLARPAADSRALVLGAGTIGLLAAMLLRDRTAEVAISARHPHQREAAKAIGAAPLDPADLDAWAREAAPDVVVETVGGSADTLGRAVSLCRAAGRVVVLGVFSAPASVDALALMSREIEVVGSNTYGTTRRGSEFAAAVALLPRYAGEIARLQTHRFPLSEVERAFETAADKRSGAIKVTVAPA